VAIMQQMPGEMKIISEETYGLMLSTLFKTENPIAQEISANYAMVDYGFLTRLDQIIADGGENAVKANEIKEAVNAEMATRMQAAAEVMKDIFASPTPVIMEGKVAGLARQGRIDDALLQLLEANLQQAQAAGEQGKGAVAVLSKLQKRVQDELDKKLDPQQTLLRQLLRMESPEARQRLLKEKMSPRATSNIVIAGVGGAEDKKDDDGSPEVPPKQMAEAIKALKQRFGNVDEQYDTGFVKKLETIGDEAEAVALELAGGREMTAQQQQDMMWNQGMVSVWDLGQIEEQAEQEGKMAVWEQEAQDQMARQDTASREDAIKKDLLGGA